MAKPRPEVVQHTCGQCGQKFQDRQQLDDHLRNEHQSEQQQERGPERKKPAA